MDFLIGDVVQMRKNHPCGGDLWEITRLGADIRIRCKKCKASVMMPRPRFTKRVKQIVERGDLELTLAMRPKFRYE